MQRTLERSPTDSPDLPSRHVRPSRSVSSLASQIKLRPALLFALSVALGIALHYSLVFLVVLGGIAWWLKQTNPIILFGIGGLIGLLIAPPIPSQGIEEQQFYQGEADVISMPRVSPLGESCVIKTPRGRVALYYGSNSEIALGDRILVTGVIKPLSEGTETYFLQKLIIGTMRTAYEPKIIESGPHLWHIAIAARTSFLSFTSRALGPEDTDIIDALCFNVESGLSEQLRDDLSRSGTIHIISTSGLHVVIVATLMSFLLRWLPIPRWSQLVLLACLLLIYAGAAGLRPPCIRAVLMSMLFSLAYIFKREPDGLSALGTSAVPFLLLSPESIFDIGFQLSFVTIGALCLFAGRENIGQQQIDLRVWSWLRLATIASLVASMASAPLVAYHFGFVSLVSVLANLLLCILIPVIVVVSLACWGLSAFSPTLSSSAMHWIAQPASSAVKAVVEYFGSQPWGSINVPPFSGWWLLPIYLMMVMVWRPSVRRA